MRSKGTAPAVAAMAIGVAFAWVSAFMPWLEAEALDESYVLRPALDAYVGIAVWLELVVLTVGVIFALTHKQAGIIGPAAALWFNVSVLFWLAGYRVASYVPSEALPDGAALQLGLGASLGTGAAILLVGATVLMLVTSTWKVRALPRASWSVPVAALASVVVLVARDAPWFEIHTSQGIDWSMSFDVIPFVGDLLGLLILTGSAGVVVVALFPRRWLIFANVVVGLVVIAASLIALAAGGLVESGASWAVERASFLGYVDPEVTTTNGPVYVAGGGALIVVASLLAWPRKREASATMTSTADVGTEPQERGAVSEPTTTPPIAATAPASAWPTNHSTSPFDNPAARAPAAAENPPNTGADDEPGGYQLPF